MNRTASILLFVCLAFATAFAASAQITTPAASPQATIVQKVGLMEAKLEYSRPSAKGREIFGDLVPYGEVWRTGANASTKITFSDTVLLEGNTTPPGTYSLLSIPGEDEWTVIINKNTELWGHYGYNADEDLLRFTVQASETPEKVETLTMNFTDLSASSATVKIAWENTVVKFKIEQAGMDEKVRASIDETIGGGQATANDYYAAASYMFSSGSELEKAAEWLNTAIEKFEEQERNVFWAHHLKAKILADLGQYQQAIEAAERSKELAQQANSADYVRLNDEAIAEWKKK